MHVEDEAVGLLAKPGDATSALAQQGRSLRRAQPARRRLGTRILAPQDQLRRPRVVKNVQAEVFRKTAAGGDAAHAVALVVETRREHTDAEPPWQDAEDATGDAALGGHADLVQPATGVVVHAASAHDAEHRGDVLDRQRAATGDRMYAVVGQRRRHQPEIATSDLQRALPEVILKHRRRVLLEDAEVAQHPADGLIAKAGVALRTVYRLVHRQRAAGERLQDLGDTFPLLVCGLAGQQAGGGNGTGIDHRIQRRAGDRIQADRVEGIPGRFYPDPPQHRRPTLIGQRSGVDERFRDRLDGEGLVGIAGGINVAVARDQANAEPVRIGLGQFRDVGSDVAVPQWQQAGV